MPGHAVPRAAGLAARALSDEQRDDFPTQKTLAGQSSRQWHPTPFTTGRRFSAQEIDI
jgi:hypothetical protein